MSYFKGAKLLHHKSQGHNKYEKILLTNYLIARATRPFPSGSDCIETLSGPFSQSAFNLYVGSHI